MTLRSTRSSKRNIEATADKSQKASHATNTKRRKTEDPSQCQSNLRTRLAATGKSFQSHDLPHEGRSRLLEAPDRGMPRLRNIDQASHHSSPPNTPFIGDDFVVLLPNASVNPKILSCYSSAASSAECESSVATPVVGEARSECRTLRNMHAADNRSQSLDTDRSLAESPLSQQQVHAVVDRNMSRRERPVGATDAFEYNQDDDSHSLLPMEQIRHESNTTQSACVSRNENPPTEAELHSNAAVSNSDEVLPALSTGYTTRSNSLIPPGTPYFDDEDHSVVIEDDQLSHADAFTDASLGTVPKDDRLQAMKRQTCNDDEDGEDLNMTPHDLLMVVNQLKCPATCSSRFADVASFRAHVGEEHSKEYALCKYADCSGAFPVQARGNMFLNHHYRKEHQLKSYRCTEHANCHWKPTYDREEYLAHVQSHKLRCNDCLDAGKRALPFATLDTLQRHVKRAHSQESFPCPHHDFITGGTCPQKFLSKGALSKHINLAHQGQYLCSMCSTGEPFNLERDLALHIKRQHPDEYTPAWASIAGDYAKVDCPLCGKTFSKRANLQVHIDSIHKGAKNFVCNRINLDDSGRMTGDDGERLVWRPQEQGCTLAYANKSMLIDHVRSDHFGMLRWAALSKISGGKVPGRPDRKARNEGNEKGAVLEA